MRMLYYWSQLLLIVWIIPIISCVDGLLSCDVSRISVANSVVIRYPRNAGSRSSRNLPNCELFINGEEDMAILLTLKSLASPSSANCKDGALSFHSDSLSQQYRQHCGTIRSPIVERFDSSQVRVKFRLKKHMANAGFHIEYQLVPRQSPFQRERERTDSFPDCGNPNLAVWEDCARIVGGCAAINGSWPWIASMALDIHDGQTHFCGATLLNDRWLLSAAHCFRERATTSGAKAIEHQGNIVIRLGANNLWSRAASEQSPLVEKVIVHDDYVDPGARSNGKYAVDFDNDIALIKLKHAVDFSEATCPIRLPAQNETVAAADTTVFLAGWGRDPYSGRDTLSQLYSARMPVVEQRACRRIHREKLTDNMLCVGVAVGRRDDACQGDSGGPLISIRNGTKVLIGIVSWGKGCGEPNSPGVYTRVANYIDWIHRKMNA